MIQCANGKDCEDLDQYNTLQINISTNKVGMGKYNSQGFINNHSYLSYKKNHSLGIRLFEELIVDKCQCAFDINGEVL